MINYDALINDIKIVCEKYHVVLEDFSVMQYDKLDIGLRPPGAARRGRTKCSRHNQITIGLKEIF